VTVIGWGSTDDIISEAVDVLNAAGISTNHLQIKWMVPFHGDEILDILSKAKRTIIVENNFSGQFARYMRSETGFSASGHIRKYDGEPFMPHHIVDGVTAQVNGETEKYIPYQEITV
jgi:2-oxoglutarate ferredoxin oxidoreductase subunit alpha